MILKFKLHEQNRESIARQNYLYNLFLLPFLITKEFYMGLLLLEFAFSFFFAEIEVCREHEGMNAKYLIVQNNDLKN